MTENPYITFLGWALEWAAEVEFQLHDVGVDKKSEKLYRPRERWRETLDNQRACTGEAIVAGPATVQFWKTLKRTSPRIEDVVLARSCDGWVVMHFKNNYTNTAYNEVVDFCNAHNIRMIFRGDNGAAPKEDWTDA